jgi:hypothetical protein
MKSEIIREYEPESLIDRLDYRLQSAPRDMLLRKATLTDATRASPPWKTFFVHAHFERLREHHEGLVWRYCIIWKSLQPDPSPFMGPLLFLFQSQE